MPGFELIGEEERAAVNQVFDDGGVLFRHGWDNARNDRYRVLEFERSFAECIGLKHALAVSSGTAALKIGLKALGVGPGDEVITQSFTFIATVEAIVDVGATPVVINIDETLNMDPSELERAITPRTKAVVPVHMLGVAAEMDAIEAICSSRGVPILEDNCESIGATWNQKSLGTIGSLGAFSFDFGKVITTGEGGMVGTDDSALYEKMLEYHDHGHQNNPTVPRGRDTRRAYGFNYRMSELQGAVGLAQLRKLDDIVACNRKHYATLKNGIGSIDGLTFRAVPRACDPMCDVLIFLLPSRTVAQEFANRMYEKEISTKNLPDALDWHFAGTWDHIFRDFGFSKEALQENLRPSFDRLTRCISLPIMVRYSEERINHIVGHLVRIAAELL